MEIYCADLASLDNKYYIVWMSLNCECLVINRKAREIIQLVASVRPSVRPSNHREGLIYIESIVHSTLCAWRGVVDIWARLAECKKRTTMTHEIQSKTSVCLSVIKERSRSKSCTQRSAAFNLDNLLDIMKWVPSLRHLRHEVVKLWSWRHSSSFSLVDEGHILTFFWYPHRSTLIRKSPRWCALRLCQSQSKVLQWLNGGYQ